MNLLNQETSPYLLQHANNPVHWLAWNEESLTKAKKEGKLMVVSVGYSACHWCHVMEHESFEDEEVAGMMNEEFISIKVDREERPDIDQVYMDAAYVTTGRGGWPLNAICLPDGRPVYAGTYFPKQQWLSVLSQLANLWNTKPELLKEQAEQILSKARSFELLPKNNSSNHEIHFREMVQSWLQTADWTFGGEQGSPKFPMPSTIEFQLAFSSYFDDERTKEFALFTIEQIAKGGIYDHVGGGFARYSVDEQWHVPHFEKMLYDNAQLLSVLSKAHQVNENKLLKQTAEETIEFLLREMRSPDNLFYSAYDADSEGEEGKFYVFSQQEINEVLENKAALFSAYFDVSERGNWEGTNVLRIVQNKETLAKEHDLSNEEFDQMIQQAKQELYTYREQRIPPGLDDKQLTSWNALTITAFCDAYRAFGEESYKKVALTTAKAMFEKVVNPDGQIFRNYKNGKATIKGFLDDYSFLAEACINLYEISFDAEWLKKAEQLIHYTKQHFYDKETGLFFYTSNQDNELVLRKKETSDNVIPASNSSLLKAMYRLAKITGNTELENEVKQTVETMLPVMEKSARYYSNWLQLALWVQEGSKEVAIVGEQAAEKRKALQCRYLPNAFYLGGTDGEDLDVLRGKFVPDKTLIYVCENHSCKQPVDKVEEAVKQIR